MTKEEFYSEYLRLHRAFPEKFMRDNPNKLRTMFEYVSALNLNWMKTFVDRAIKKNDPDLDIFKAAAGELRAMKQKKQTEEVLKREVEITEENGLKKVLMELGASSLLDAVLKQSKRKSNS